MRQEPDLIGELTSLTVSRESDGIQSKFNTRSPPSKKIRQQNVARECHNPQVKFSSWTAPSKETDKWAADERDYIQMKLDVAREFDHAHDKCNGRTSPSKEIDKSIVDQNDYIQRQLSEIIHSQQRLENMVSKFVGVDLYKAEVPTRSPLARFPELDSNGIHSSSKLLETDLGEAITLQLEEDQHATETVLERRRKRLGKILRDNRHSKISETQKQRNRLQEWKKHPVKSLIGFVMREELLDAVMAVIIFTNAIFIGASLDHRVTTEWDVWLIADAIFFGLFFVEFCLKVILHGGVKHFTGKDKFSNCFDTVIVILDGYQLYDSIRAVGKDEQSVRSASVFRIIRLMRIVRLIRLLKVEGMKTFVDMMQGILDGAQTLFWAIVMFAFMVYGGGVLCKICFGSEKLPVLNSYFDTVPRAMLTVFRCAFGDCSTEGGTPIPEFMLQEKGTLHALGYCLFMFFITIGLFNIISAIFVDSTMSASATVASATKLKRLSDSTLWATSVANILGVLLENHQEGLTLESIEEDVDSLVVTEFSRIEIDAVVGHDPRVQDALDKLDIDKDDHKRLSDILDPDHSGTITVLELVEGLRRLRGDPRRSDVVSVDLMIRSLQLKQDEILAELLQIKANGHEKANGHKGIHEQCNHVVLATPLHTPLELNTV